MPPRFHDKGERMHLTNILKAGSSSCGIPLHGWQSVKLAMQVVCNGIPGGVHNSVRPIQVDGYWDLTHSEASSDPAFASSQLSRTLLGEAGRYHEGEPTFGETTNWMAKDDLTGEPLRLYNTHLRGNEMILNGWRDTGPINTRRFNLYLSKDPRNDLKRFLGVDDANYGWDFALPLDQSSGVAIEIDLQSLGAVLGTNWIFQSDHFGTKFLRLPPSLIYRRTGWEKWKIRIDLYFKDLQPASYNEMWTKNGTGTLYCIGKLLQPSITLRVYSDLDPHHSLSTNEGRIALNEIRDEVWKKLTDAIAPEIEPSILAASTKPYSAN